MIIDEEIKTIKDAKYGREVRGAIVDGLTKIDKTAKEAKDNADKVVEDYEQFSKELQKNIDNRFSGLELDEVIVRRAFDELKINGENLYEATKPKVIGLEGEWKRATIVVPDLKFSKYSDRTLASITLDNYIDDNIGDAIVVGVQSQIKTYPISGTEVCPACYGCSKIPIGVWVANFIDLNNNENECTAYTAIDVLYKKKIIEETITLQATKISDYIECGNSFEIANINGMSFGSIMCYLYDENQQQLDIVNGITMPAVIDTSEAVYVRLMYSYASGNSIEITYKTY